VSFSHTILILCVLSELPIELPDIDFKQSVFNLPSSYIGLSPTLL